MTQEKSDFMAGLSLDQMVSKIIENLTHRDSGIFISGDYKVDSIGRIIKVKHHHTPPSGTRAKKGAERVKIQKIREKAEIKAQAEMIQAVLSNLGQIWETQPEDRFENFEHFLRCSRDPKTLKKRLKASGVVWEKRNIFNAVSVIKLYFGYERNIIV